MKLRIASDLHTEFWPGSIKVDTLDEVLPPLETDGESVLCLGGDTGLLHRAETWLTIIKHLAKRFKAVVFILGNHEFYHNNYFNRIHMLQREVKLPANVYFLEDQSITIEDTVFIGSTLWTDMNEWDELTMRMAFKSMMDYRCMRLGLGLLAQVSDTILKFEDSKKFIFSTLADFNTEAFKTVVLTHHMPSYLSVDPLFKGDLLNPAFVTELQPEIEEAKPDVWIHGHTHSSCDYKIDNTRVICNPYGYRDVEVNKKYIKDLVIDI